MSSKPNYVTTNKSDRDIDKQFDQRQFNLKFIENDKIIEEELKIKQETNNVLPVEPSTLLPHQRPIEDIIILIRETFYLILSKVINGENPVQYILSSPDNFFALTIFIIITGALLMLFSNILISPNK